MTETHTITRGKGIITHLQVAMEHKDANGIGYAKRRGQTHDWSQETPEVQKRWSELLHIHLADELETSIREHGNLVIQDRMDALEALPKNWWNDLDERLRTRIQNLMEWGEEKLLGHDS